ncbi:hypothetical protein PANDA_005197 [Ailuropoda melanoleuca]|uniref:LRRNT domain-containing protein n=1 Tax=Ailuropoda melanoleuca TaxID=9646 RepID=D2H5L5_AILME|nr:hypothetical protein PANDA_005197 [Ailuropoda melanoleuca]
MVAPWSFSPEQATQPFSSPLCSPRMPGLNIRFHLSEMEECCCEWRKVFAGFPTPTDILPTPPPPPAQWAEIVSPGAAWRLGATACPALCTCTGTTVDCHGTGLQAIPKNIPRNTERLELNGNNITRIHKNDFAGLKQLRVLQLMENQIGVVERGAFDDMKELERLRLNRNQLHLLPELLFQNNQALSRLVGEQMALQGSWRSGAPISCDTCDPVRQTVLYGFTAEESQDESQGWRGPPVGQALFSLLRTLGVRCVRQTDEAGMKACPSSFPSTRGFSRASKPCLSGSRHGPKGYGKRVNSFCSLKALGLSVIPQLHRFDGLSTCQLTPVLFDLWFTLTCDPEI